ncbi:hypothetical protein BN1013_00067 [Candidatus Rubidus massiliensis]|nr:MAG: hypothetical protein BGO10_07305 [Chlamydia sp. 32-24]CDZ79573.1 hypothetical protein BN1013_00067 [Candidatus Rubidus massiliensis]
MIKKLFKLLQQLPDELTKRPILASILSFAFTLILENWILRRFKFLHFLSKKNIATIYTFYTFAKKWVKLLKKT